MNQIALTASLALAAAALAGSPAADASGWKKRTHRIVVVLEAQNQPPSSVTTIPDIDGDGMDDNADLCIDGDLVNPRTGRKVGTGTECLSFTEAGPIATTTFNFWRGSMTARGKMNLAPVTWLAEDHPDVDGSVGDLSGYFPAPGTNNILKGTRRFRHASGRVRLSGGAKVNDDGTFNLNCIFIIEFD